jgi:hypothetical protein
MPRLYNAKQNDCNISDVLLGVIFVDAHTVSEYLQILSSPARLDTNPTIMLESMNPWHDLNLQNLCTYL